MWIWVKSTSPEANRQFLKLAKAGLLQETPAPHVQPSGWDDRSTDLDLVGDPSRIISYLKSLPYIEDADVMPYPPPLVDPPLSQEELTERLLSGTLA